MRNLLPLLAALALLLSGCSDDEAGTDDVPAPTDAAAPAAQVPEPMHWEGEVPVGADPFNVVPVVPGPCSTQASTCFKHEFTVPEGTEVDLEATLAWGLAANDFDLYLYEGDEQLSSDGINAVPPAAQVPEPQQVLHYAGLEDGTYAFWVVAWNAVGDAYTLDVTFTAA